jgi:hypothetical protein
MRIGGQDVARIQSCVEATTAAVMLLHHGAGEEGKGFLVESRHHLKDS